MKKFQVLQCWMFSFEGWRFLLYRSLDVLYESLGISKLKVLIKKMFFNQLNFFNLSLSKPWIWTGIDQKCWIRIRTEINKDPQHCLTDSANQDIFDDRLRSTFATDPEQLAYKQWQSSPPPDLSTSTVNIWQTELWSQVYSSYVFFLTVVELNEFS